MVAGYLHRDVLVGPGRPSSLTGTGTAAQIQSCATITSASCRARRNSRPFAWPENKKAHPHAAGAPSCWPSGEKASTPVLCNARVWLALSLGLQSGGTWTAHSATVCLRCSASPCCRLMLYAAAWDKLLSAPLHMSSDSLKLFQDEAPLMRGAGNKKPPRWRLVEWMSGGHYSCSVGFGGAASTDNPSMMEPCGCRPVNQATVSRMAPYSTLWAVIATPRWASSSLRLWSA